MVACVTFKFVVMHVRVGFDLVPVVRIVLIVLMTSSLCVGNCNMAAYKSGNQNWWVEPMLQDDSPCTPACPPDGC